MESTLDFGELSHDEDLKSKVKGFESSFKEVEKIIDTFCSLNIYNDLTKEDKVRYDLFQAFAINTLYWLYLRTCGIDPNQHDIRGELNRIRGYMTKSKKIYERKNLMPRIDQGAAKRFVQHGLWTPSLTNSPVNDINEVPALPKKRKRESSDDE